jgi:beta-lactamase regulating signal transducer with metallopeptidase domain/HEAT repeat protein
MTPNLLSEIIALPGWNTSMLMLLAKATVILVAAIGITMIMKRGSAGARHLVWLVTLGGLLLVPALTAWAPLRLAVLPADAPAPVAAPSVTAPAPQINSDNNEPAAVPASSPIQSQVSTVKEGSRFSAMTGLSLVLAMWAAVVFAILASLVYGTFLVRRIVRNSTVLDTEDWVSPLYEVSDRMGLEEPPRLLRSEYAKMPFACGVFRPTIVLPAECDHWTLDRRRAVLLHELAHVRRHDLAGHTLGRLACAFYWFHPLVWTAAKQLRNESERACDDIALACGARASDYAEHLLEIVTSVRGDQTPNVALAMARRKEFEGRMLAILDPELRHSGPSRKQSFGLIASLALISVVVGAAAPAHRDAPNSSMQDDLSIQVGPVAAEEQDNPIKSDLSQNVKKDSALDVDPSTVNQTLSVKTSTSVNQVTSENIGTIARSAATLGINAAASALAKVDLGSEEGLKALIGSKKESQDDRAALLANILRTETDPALRRVAAWGLADYADTREGESALAYALGHDASAEVREMAAWALGDGDGSGNAFDALSNAALKDANLKVRRTAVWALGSTGDHAAVVPLTTALSDADPEIRMRAIWGLGSVEPKSAPPQLVAMLQDRNGDVRHLVAWALYQIEDPGAAGALNAALKVETDKTLQLSYIRALAAAGEKSVDAIRGLLDSKDPQIKSMAIRALAGGRGSEPWPWPWPQPRPFP